MSGFFWRFVEREGVACLEIAQLSGFGFPSGKNKQPLFALLWHTRASKRTEGFWNSAPKLKILGRLRLFRLVVIGVGRLQPSSVSCCKHGAPILSREFR